MRMTTPLKAAAIMLALNASTMPAMAQMESNDRQPSGMTRAGDSSTAPFIAELNFKGGPFEAFVEALREAAGDQPVNIVYPPEAGGLPVPPVNLREVDVYTALRSAQPGSDRPIRVGEQVVVWWTDRIAGDGAPVYTVEVRDVRDPRIVRPSGAQLQQQTVVHTITELTTGSGRMSADDVLSAIQAALAIEGGDEDTQLRFHEQTGLVFARVTPNQGSVIEQTLVNLDRSMQARQRGESKSEVEAIYQATGTRSADELVMRVRAADDMRARVLELQRTIAELQTHIIRLQDELDRRMAAEREDGN